ncbi:hypothetical protein [Streptomyces sp. NPDC093261]|uniref:hypothetical protein n=1 Tax=Streptomyces sp. NPDC093261 TaxID=3366037 RepID=UPI0038291B83
MAEEPLKPYTLHTDGTAVNTLLVLHRNGEDIVVPIDSAHWHVRVSGETELTVTIPGALVRIASQA